LTGAAWLRLLADIRVTLIIPSRLIAIERPYRVQADRRMNNIPASTLSAIIDRRKGSAQTPDAVQPEAAAAVKRTALA
jgi:hypothetical protein